MADLDLIVDFSALADDGIAQAAAIDGRSSADFHVVLDQHPAGLRHLHMAIRAKEHETVAVLTDAAAGMDQDIIADQRALDGTVCPDIAIAANPDVGGDHRPRPDHGAGADFNMRADHRERIDNDTIFQMRRGIDDGGFCDARVTDPGLRP